MIYGTLPFRGKNEKELKDKIRAAKLVFPKDVAITNEGKSIITSMLSAEPSERMSLLNLMETPYSKYDDETFEKLVKDSELLIVKTPTVENEEEKFD